MTAQEFIESKQFKAAGKINTSDALIAVQLAKMEGAIMALQAAKMPLAVMLYETEILKFKKKHNLI